MVEKGLSRRQLTLCKLRAESKEKWREGEDDWLDCDENIGKGSISLADR